MLLAWGLFFGVQATAQQDLLKGIFDSEEPVFYTSVLPATEAGTIRLVVYFSHSKISELEASVWLQDRGTTLTTDGAKQLARGLQMMGNRRPDTILITRLSDLHFYTFGVDYRNPKALGGKFSTAVLQEGFRYEAPRPAAPPPVAAEPPRDPVMTNPCVEPDISVSIDASGYCGANDRPAVRIQCRNCEEREWEFSVEVRTETEAWHALRADGRRQSAFGGAVRTEPLCILSTGLYYARVLVWGKNCTMPLIRQISTPVVITERGPSPYAYQAVPSTPQSSSMNRTLRALPDTCVVEGYAQLTGPYIRGGLMLASQSPCAAFFPYAVVRYIHPGYRDLTQDPMPLTPGQYTPFEIQLDQKDLARSIHPIQVIVYARQQIGEEGIPLSSFWIRTEAGDLAVRSPLPQSYNAPPPPPSGIQPMAPVDAYSIDEAMLEETFDTVGVRASDPNCNQIADLKLAYDPLRPGPPIFVSWLSPRCCQVDGCAYSVWVGKSHNQLRLLVRGNKPGAIVQELLTGVQPDDQYFEVVVNTANGMRKAAYVVGDGPKYGIEEITAYHDRVKPPYSDSLLFERSAPPPTGAKENIASSVAEQDQPTASTQGIEPPANSNGPQFRWNDTPVGSTPVSTSPASAEAYVQPRLPLQNFSPCHYQRETQLIGDQPAEVGDLLTLRYNFSEEGYRYTLYLRPRGSQEWVIAPGTQELQANPAFDLRLTPRHNGEYLILTYKPSKNWGCLSAPLTKAVKLEVAGNY